MSRFTKGSPSAIRAGLNRVMRAIICKSRMILTALSIGLVGLTTTVSGAEPSLQQQLETMKRQLEQQQRTIEQMQRQLEEQNTANEQRLPGEQQMKQQVVVAEGVAQQADGQTREVAPIAGVDISRETDGLAGEKGLNVKVHDTDTVLTISGFIRASAIHDFDKIGSPTQFLSSEIVVNDEPAGQPSDRTTFTANASRFILAGSTPTESGKLSAFLSWDFDDNTTSSKAELRLRQAWAQLDDFVLGGDVRFGQAWTVWDDLAALPETMDLKGPNGSQKKRKPLIQWSRGFQDNLTLWVALENPDYKITNGSTESVWPDTVVSLKWQGDWGHLKPALVGRQIKGEDSNGGSDTVIGWGTALSGKIKVPLLAEKDNFKFQLIYGAGIAGYNDDKGFDDALFTNDGDLKTIDSFQGYGAFQHWWTNMLRSSAVFGWVDVDNRDEQSDDSLGRTLYAAGNLVWSPYQQVDVGFEYLWGERENNNNDDGTATRIQFTGKMKF